MLLLFVPDWYNYTSSDILGPEHPQEAPLSRNRPVHYTIYAKWTNGHSQTWDPLYPQSRMRRGYCSLCHIHHLGMKSFQFRKFLKKQKKELHLCRAASTLFIRGLVGGKDIWRYLKGCIQTAGGRQGQLSVSRWFSRTMALGWGVAIMNNMKCRLTFPFQKKAISKEKTKVTCFPLLLCCDFCDTAVHTCLETCWAPAFRQDLQNFEKITL